jgi:hypothetical protein
MITSSGGAISITGTGGSGGSANCGVTVNSGGTVEASSGPLSITGTSGPGSSATPAVNLDPASNANVLSTGSGPITITAIGNGSAVEFSGYANATFTHTIGGPSDTGPITIIANGVNLDGGSGAASIQTTGTINIFERTSGTPINLGGAGAIGATPTLGLSAVEIDDINAPTINIGNANCGSITVSAMIEPQTTTAFNLTAAAVSLNANVSVSGSGALTVVATGSIVIGGAATTISTAGGNLTLSANQQAIPTGGNFVGINVNDATIESATGSVLLQGTGGNDASGAQYGVEIQAAGNVQTTGNGGTVTVVGAAGASPGNSNQGVLITGSGSAVVTAGGNVSITGIGGTSSGGAGTNDYGVSIATNSSVTAGGSGTVSIQGTGAASSGSGSVGVQVTGSVGSSGGNISITGNGGASSADISASNYGVQISGAGIVTAGGSGSVTVQGYGGPSSGNGNVGVFVTGSGSTITSSGGNVAVFGFGGGVSSSSSVNNNGVDVSTGGEITAGGLGTVAVQGTGAASSGNGNDGVVVTGSGATITSGGGNISITGAFSTSSGATGSNNTGIYIAAAGSITASGSGTVTVQGTGAASSGNANDGVVVTGTGSIITSTGGNVSVAGMGGTSNGGSGTSNYGVGVITGGTVTAGGSGTVIVNGTGAASAGNGNNGVVVTGTGAMITSGGGNVSVTGIGGASSGSTGTNNNGVYVAAGGTVTAGVIGSVTVEGTGAASASNANSGVVVTGAGSIVTSTGGNVSVTGMGGTSSGGSGTNSTGVDVVTGGTVTAGGSGTVTVQGTGAASTGDYNGGVAVSGAGAIITSGGGNVSVTGTGGGATATSVGDDGIAVLGGTITAEGSGTVIVQGTGGPSGGTNNYGVSVNGSGSVITSSGGNVTVTGTGGSGGIYNDGVNVASSGTIEVSDSSLSIIGIAGAGTSAANGVSLGYNSNANILSTSSGSITITAAGAGNGLDLSETDTATIGGPGDAGPITIIANSMALSGDSETLSIQTTGTVTMFARTSGVSIYLDATLSAPGTLLASTGFAAGGMTLGLSLGFAPTLGTQLTIINNTATPAASNPINGEFDNLPQGGIYTASYAGTSYTFQANYQGGDGNDLVLTAIASASPARDSTVAVGTRFSAVITIKNTGTTTWAPGPNGYTLNRNPQGIDPFQQGSIYYATLSSPVAPGGTGTFTISLAAPTAPGTYTETWQMSDTNYQYFGPTVTLLLNVVTNLPAPTLVSPGTGSAPGTALSSDTPQFQWQPVSGAEGYALYISQLQADGTYGLIFNSSMIGGPLTGDSYNLPAGVITSDGQYRWNMATYNAAGYGSPNASRDYFTVNTGAVQLPSINSVSPNPITADASDDYQMLTINGSNFASQPTIVLTWTGQPGYALPASQVTFVSSTQLTITTNLGAVADNWTVEVIDPGGQTSSAFGFQVLAPVAGSPPQAPTGGTVTPLVNESELSWTATPGASSYEIFRNTTNDQAKAKETISGITSTNYDDATATPGITYYYWVVAVNGSQASTPSAPTTGAANSGAAGTITLGPLEIVNLTGNTTQIGFAPGTGQSFNPLLTVAGIVSYDNSTLSIDGTVSYDVGSVSSTLLTGTFQIPVGQTAASPNTVTDTDPDSGIQIAGLPVSITGLALISPGPGVASAEIEVTGKISLQTTKITAAVLITDQGIELESGTIKLPKTSFSVGPLSLTATGMSVGYDSAEDQFVVQGELALTNLWGGASITADLTGDGNGIFFQGTTVYLAGTFSANNFTVNGWGLNHVSLTIDTRSLSTWSGSADVDTPWFNVGASIMFLNGQFDDLSLTLTNVTIPTPVPDLELTGGSASIINLAPGASGPITLSGTLDFTLGPDIDIDLPDWLGGNQNITLATLELGVSVSAGDLSGQATVVVADGLATVTGTVDFNLSTDTLSAKGMIDAADGAFSGSGQLTIGNGNVILSADGTAEIPSGIIPGVGHVPLASGGLYLSYQESAQPAQDYLEVWGSVSIAGFHLASPVVRVGFDGAVSLHSSKDLPNADPPQSAIFSVSSGTPWALLGASWTSSSDDVPFDLEAPDGTIYTQSNLPANIGVIDQTDDSTIGVGIQNPESGNWTFTLLDTSSLGSVTFQGIGGTIVSSTQLAFLQSPTYAVSGTSFGPVVVAVEDQNGDVISTDDSVVTLNMTGGPGDISTIMTSEAQNGIATFTGVAPQIAGNYTIQATDGTDTAASTASVVTPATVVNLALAQQPSDVVAGEVMAPAIVVQATDPYGNVVSGDTITLDVESYPSGAVYSSFTTTTDDNGDATFDGISVSTAGSYVFVATDATTSTGNSNSFVVSPAAASMLVFGQQPSNVATGIAISPNVVVDIEDQFGNLVTTDNSNVTLTLNSGDGALNGTLMVQAQNGVATFSGLSLNGAGIYTIGADDGVLATISTAFTIVQAAPTVTIGSPPRYVIYDGTSDVTNWAAPSVSGVSGAANPTGSSNVVFYEGTSVTGTPLASAPVNLGTYTAVAIYSGDANYDAAESAPVTFAILADTPPVVVGAFVSGTAWNASYLSMLDASGLGSSAAGNQGFELASGANQLTTMLPWTNVTQISIAFSEFVNVSPSSLTLYNSTNTAIFASSVSYNSTANIATWQFATALPADKYVMNLAGTSVTDSNDTDLDGAWTTSVSTFATGSGNGAPGSDFNFYFDVLPGDANSSGTVTNGDVLITKLQVGAVTNSSNYLLDVNASGNITNGDVLLEKLQVGSNINTFASPSLPPQSAADAPDDDRAPTSDTRDQSQVVSAAPVSVSTNSPPPEAAPEDDPVSSDSTVAAATATVSSSSVPVALPTANEQATISIASVLVVSPDSSTTDTVTAVPSPIQITPAPAAQPVSADTVSSLMLDDASGGTDFAAVAPTTAMVALSVHSALPVVTQSTGANDGFDVTVSPASTTTVSPAVISPNPLLDLPTASPFVLTNHVALAEVDSSAEFAAAPAAASPITASAADTLFQSLPESSDARSTVAEPGGDLDLLLSALGPTSSSPVLAPAVGIAGLAAPTSRPGTLPASGLSVPASPVVLDVAHSAWLTARTKADLSWDLESVGVKATALALTDAAFALPFSRMIARN